MNEYNANNEIKKLQEEIEKLNCRLDGLQEAVYTDIYLLNKKRFRSNNEKIISVVSIIACALIIISAYLINVNADIAYIIVSLGFTLIATAVLGVSVAILIVTSINDIILWIKNKKSVEG